MADTRSATNQEGIRQWARENNIPVGHRGRLPRSVVEVYHKRVGNTADGTSSPERPERSPDATTLSFDPFADYLESRFGSMYDALGDTWTPELEAAVKDYLLREISDADYAFLELVYKWPSGNRAAEDADYAALVRQVYGWQTDSRQSQVAWVIDHNPPWKISYILHRLAIRNTPTLRAVLTHRPDYLEAEDLTWDAATWLDAHAAYDELKALARSRGLTRRIPTLWDFPKALEPTEAARIRLVDILVSTLSPGELADTWDHIASPAEQADPAPTDLTDEEWELLKPLLGHPTSNTREAQRQTTNGILFQHAHRGQRRSLPSRYGKRANVEGRKVYYRQSGKFAKILAELQDKPEAARIVTWLRSELEGPATSQGDTHD